MRFAFQDIDKLYRVLVPPQTDVVTSAAPVDVGYNVFFLFRTNMSKQVDDKWFLQKDRNRNTNLTLLDRMFSPVNNDIFNIPTRPTKTSAVHRLQSKTVQQNDIEKDLRIAVSFAFARLEWFSGSDLTDTAHICELSKETRLPLGTY